MFLSKTGLIIGYHGCDQSVRDALVANNLSFKKSENGYDWLGHGMYFWDNDAERALEFAKFKKEHPQEDRKTIENPSVVAAVINLGYCLDLVNSGSLQLLKFAYNVFTQNIIAKKGALIKNKPLKSGHDLIFRYLDCAVIEMLHTYRQENNLQPFDSVRGVFWEGDDLYENAGFKEKNHIQICIRNAACVEGFFIPKMNSDSIEAL